MAVAAWTRRERESQLRARSQLLLGCAAVAGFVLALGMPWAIKLMASDTVDFAYKHMSEADALFPYRSRRVIGEISWAQIQRRSLSTSLALLTEDKIEKPDTDFDVNYQTTRFQLWVESTVGKQALALAMSDSALDSILNATRDTLRQRELRINYGEALRACREKTASVRKLLAQLESNPPCNDPAKLKPGNPDSETDPDGEAKTDDQREAERKHAFSEYRYASFAHGRYETFIFGIRDYLTALEQCNTTLSCMAETTASMEKKWRE